MKKRAKTKTTKKTAKTAQRKKTTRRASPRTKALAKALVAPVMAAIKADRDIAEGEPVFVERKLDPEPVPISSAWTKNGTVIVADGKIVEGMEEAAEKLGFVKIENDDAGHTLETIDPNAKPTDAFDTLTEPAAIPEQFGDL